MNLILISVRYIYILLVFTVISCGAVSTDSSSSTTSGGSGGSGDSTSGGGTSSGSGGGSGEGSGSGTSADTSAFTVTGQLSSSKVSTLALPDTDLEGLKEASTATVTHVVAVSPEPGNRDCKIATVDSNGSFKVPLTSGRPWMFSFIDKLRPGNMFLGMFRFSGFSNFGTLWPNKRGGSLNLGNISLNGFKQIASSTLSDDNIFSAMNLDSVLSNAVRSLGNMAERYQNPDLDGNGTPDCAEKEAKHLLDFHVRFDMKMNGIKPTITDIIDNFLNETSATPSYTGTGIYVAYPASFSSATTGSVTFVDSDVTTSEGGLIPANTATSSVTSNSFSGYNGFGPNTTVTSELPSGKIIFSFGGKTLAFTGVQTPSLAQITAPTGRIFPFIKFTKADSTCSSNCKIGSLSYKWMKKTEGGWTEASLTELGLIISDKGGFVSFRVNQDIDDNKKVGVTLPISNVSGSIAWDSSKATLTGVTASEFSSITTTQICHLGLSYDDRLGMRYFEGIDNAVGTCQQGS